MKRTPARSTDQPAIAAESPAEVPPAREVAPASAERSTRLLPVVAGIAIVLWTLAFVWSRPGGDGEPWTRLLVQWAIPVLLVIGLWLLALRYTSREARRLDEIAGALSSGPASLESRLAAINRELAAARDLFAAHPREFEAVGHLHSFGERMPAIAESARDIVSQIDLAGTAARTRLDEVVEGFDRLSKAGDASSAHLTSLHENLARSLAALEDSSARLDKVTEERFEHLRVHAERFKVEIETREQDNLSAIRRRADELSKALSTQDIAMRTRAGQGMDELQARIKSIRDDGLRLSGEVEKIQGEALRGWDRAVSEIEARMQETVGKVVEVDDNAMQNARTRLAALHDEAERIDAEAAERLKGFEAEIARRRDESLARGKTALAEFEKQLDDFDQKLDARRKAQLARLAELGERSQTLAAGMAGIDKQLAAHVEQCEAASNALGSFAGDLSDRLAESREHLEVSGQSLGEMTEASVRLFELIRSSADYSSDTIPAALAEANARLGEFEQRTFKLREAIVSAEEKSAALAGHLDRTREGVPVSAETLDALSKRLEDIAAKSDALAQRTRKELSAAIGELENSSRSMADRLRAGQEKALGEFAATFGERSLAVVGKGLREKTEAALAELERAAEGSARAGQETVAQLRSQLAEVTEMAGNLEARVARAREQAQEEPTKDFSIEMTKIIEKLNSASIDIAKIFDADVSDMAWQAYLRGDYGIFTRKAVKLLPSQKSDVVLGFYRQDAEFRETVNRYIHDFESMLRVVLATRNGHAMAVTLLSSEIGKLYVALAQATERLRE